MTEENKNSKNFDNQSWWRLTKSEKILVGLTIVTILVSVVSQAGLIVNNLLQFDNIYKQLYPLLNIFHIYVLFYIIFQLQDIKQLLPSQKDEGYTTYRKKLKEWITQHFGSIYWKDKTDDELGKYVDKLTRKTNKNIAKTYTYFYYIFCCFVVLYIFELINSSTYAVNEPVLHILIIIFNNIATLFWFYIYLTLDASETTIEINQKDKRKIIHTCSYWRSKWCNRLWRRLTFATMFKRPNKFEEYETGENEKYKTIEISKWPNWKFGSSLCLILSTMFFIGFIVCFKIEEILEIEKLKDDSISYLLFRFASIISVLLGGCAMLATFSRLSSGFKKVPLSAFIIMLFYAAIQPLFFAGSEFSSALKFGQTLFITNLLCLLGKFGLLHLIRWFFKDYQIAYYFIAEQIVKDKSEKEELKLNKLFVPEKKQLEKQT